MTCSQCGATIADKALICYKCGAQTAAPRHRAAAVGAPARGWRWPILILAVLVVALALAWRAGLVGAR